MAETYGFDELELCGEMRVIAAVVGTTWCRDMLRGERPQD